MAINGKATRADFVEEGVFKVGRDFAKSLDPAIESTIEWKEALSKLKQEALEYAKIEGQFKISKDRKEFLKLKQEEEKLRQQAARSTKAEQDALIAIQKAKKAELDTDKAKLTVEAKKQAAQKRAIKLTEQEKLERRLLTRAQREAAVISSKLATEYEKQAIILTQLRRRYKDVALRQGESSTEARRLQREITKLDATLKKVDANVGQFQRNVGNYPKALNAARKAALSFASAIGYTGAAFLAVATVRDAINVVREFDKQLIAVQKTTNFTNPEINKFKKEVIALGQELDGISTQGLLESSIIAGQLGIKGSKNVLRFAETIEKLGLTSDLVGEESAESFAKFIEVSSDTVENADRLGSVITELGNNFATTESKILKNTTEIQKGISIYNTSAQSVIALGAATNALGSEAEASRGAFQTVFKILNDGAVTGRNLDRILRITGQTAAEFRREFANDSVKVFQRFIKGLSEVEGQGKNLSSTLNELGLSEKRATAVVGSLAKNYNVLEDALSRANDEYERNTALNQEAEKSAESLDSKIGDLGDAWQNLIVNVDEGTGAVSKFFKGAIEGFTNFVKGIGELNTSTTEQGVNAARNIVEDFKNSTEIVEGETKGFIVRTIQEADKNIGTLQGRIAELKDSFLISEGEDGRLLYYGVDFGTNTLDEIKELQGQLEKEKATREELGRILVDEGRAKDKLVRETAKLAQEAAERQGREINLANQVNYFQTLSIDRLKQLNKEYSNSVKEIGNVEKAESALERQRRSARVRNNANALDNFRLKQQIKELDELAKNEENSFTDRQAAIESRAEKEIQLAKQLAAQKIENKKGEADAIKLIEEQLQAQIKEIQKREDADLVSLDFAKLDRENAIAKAKFEKRLNDEIRAEREAFAAREIPQEDFEREVEAHERRIAEIKKRYALEALNGQVRAIETLLKAENLSAQKRAEYERQLSEIKNEIAGISADSFINANSKRVENEKITTGEILDLSGGLADALSGLTDTIFNNRIQKLDAELERNQERYDKALANEELTEKQRKRLEGQREADRARIEKKKRAEQRKQAVYAKAAAAFQIGLTTAQNILSALSGPPIGLGPVAGIPLSITMGAIGAVQLGAVLAQKIPQYFKGTDDHPGGLAMVGEIRPEVIQEPNKSPYIVDRPTILDLPRHTVVTPSVDEYEKIFNTQQLEAIKENDARITRHEQMTVIHNTSKVDNSRLEQKLDENNRLLRKYLRRGNIIKNNIKIDQPTNYRTA